MSFQIYPYIDWRNSMFRLFRYARNYKKEVILGPIFKFLEAVFELLLPLFMAKLVDQGIPPINIGINLKRHSFYVYYCTLIQRENNKTMKISRKHKKVEQTIESFVKVF